MNKTKQISMHWDILLVSITVFIGMFYFFHVSHPIYIYDTDDWTYIGYIRPLFPTTNEWNPTKILPETFLPFICKTGVIFIKSITGNYIESLSLAFAICYSFIITIYFVFLMVAVKKVVRINKTASVLLFLTVTLLHFYIFKNGTYLFFELTINNVFNYTIPNLFNIILVLMLMTYRRRLYELKPVLKGGFILLVYMCINSNLYSNVILMSYIGTELLFDIYTGVEGKNWFLLIKNRLLELAICFVWIGSLIFEVNGDRAKSNASISIVKNLKTTVKAFIDSLHTFRYGAYLIMLFCVLLYIMITIQNSKDNQNAKLLRKINKNIIMVILSLIYLMVLSSKVNPAYLARSSVMFTWMFGLILSFCYCYGYLLSKYSASEILLFVSFYAIFLKTSIHSSYLDIGQYRPDINKAVSEYIYNQVTEAYSRGQYDVDVLVPKYDSSDNFPIALYGGDRIANTLFNHGVTHRRMNITLIPDDKVNEMFHFD